ncbi:MAG: arylsulfatase [Solibacterales bacterium]|nr:arylsulfatase [Bryobacterales bacterium]|tara:strand:+ start:2891 stop:4312 length:1422 start_codon:yes stop_codon:yes gene_type:complete
MKHLTQKIFPLIVVSFVFLTLLFDGCSSEEEKLSKPNVVIVFLDDLGYGDFSSYGHPTIKTPMIDQLAREGQRWTSFYTAASVCTPSRGALLTGRLPVRNGLAGKRASHRVFFPYSTGGIPQSEITIAEILKGQGYKTAAIGKWHLGHLPQYLPTRHGFDSYFGIPFSNDMDAVAEWSLATLLEPPHPEHWDIPLMRDEETIERPVNQSTITRRYTEEAVKFVSENRENSFFLYLAHTMPHTPLFAGEKFIGTSKRGLYGDVVTEIDWSVGQIVSIIKELRLERKTLFVLTSDNGPWLSMLEHGGSAGLLREGKGTTWEGGMRVPAIFWWPGIISPKVVSDIGSTLDILPTITSFVGADLSPDHILDGYDLAPILLGKQPSPRKEMYFYRRQELYAIRKGPFKAHFVTEDAFADDVVRKEHDPPLLFNLEHDPSEQYNVAKQHPEVMDEIQEMVRDHQAVIKIVESEVAKYRK